MVSRRKPRRKGARPLPLEEPRRLQPSPPRTLPPTPPRHLEPTPPTRPKPVDERLLNLALEFNALAAEVASISIRVEQLKDHIDPGDTFSYHHVFDALEATAEPLEQVRRILISQAGRALAGDGYFPDRRGVVRMFKVTPEGKLTWCMPRDNDGNPVEPDGKMILTFEQAAAMTGRTRLNLHLLWESAAEKDHPELRGNGSIFDMAWLTEGGSSDSKA